MINLVCLCITVLFFSSIILVCAQFVPAFKKIVRTYVSVYIVSPGIDPDYIRLP
jgi:hypothetical protein